MSVRTRFNPRSWPVGLIAIIVGLITSPIAPADDRDSNTVRLAGTVVDESGKAVAGAEIWASQYLNPNPKPVRSDNDGAFRLDVETSANGRIFVNIFGRGEGNLLGVLPFFKDANETKPIQVVLKPAHAMEVAVKDGDGKAVEGAEVHFKVTLLQFLEGKTNAEGIWKAEVTADSKNWKLYALKSKIGFDYASAERARGSNLPLNPLPDRLTLTLDGARSPLTVKTVDRAGKPLGGIKVHPWFIKKPGRESDLNGLNDTAVTSDADGLAILDWLPARLDQAFGIVASHDDYHPSEYAEWVTPDKPSTELTITLLRSERLSGKVTTADGQPAADVSLQIVGQGAGNASFQGVARTDAEGRYSLKVYSEQAYLLTAEKGDLVAPVKSGVVVREGKAVEGVDLVLGRGTKLKGRVTLGKDRKPAEGIFVQAVLDKGSIPPELKREGDRLYHGLQLRVSKSTDKEGRYEFLLGPGEYTIQGPARVEPFKLTIADQNAPEVVVQDLEMPRPVSGPLKATIVNEKKEPVSGAIVNGAYESFNAYFSQVIADANGTIQMTRSLDPLFLAAKSPDGSLNGLIHLDAEATEAQLILKPAASASGRLVNTKGEPVADQKLEYGIRVLTDPAKKNSSPFSWYFGGNTTTGKDGSFLLKDLVVGAAYELHIYTEKSGRFHSAQTKVKPTEPALLALGDVVIDMEPVKDYVPPTPAERTEQSFAAKKERTPREKLDYTLVEAKREYTQPLILFGNAKAPECVELFRLFSEMSDLDESKKAGHVKSPGDLRWEYELATLDGSKDDVKALAKELGVPNEANSPPTLAVLSESGKLLETYPLRLGKESKLDPLPLGAFLLKHKLPTRNAETMLNEAMTKAKAENKRIFLIMSASWCGPCRLLARYLVENKAELERHFVFVKLDISRDTEAEVLRERYEGKENSNGVPWYAVLDDAGKTLITSNSKVLEEDGGQSNIGFPSSKEGIDHLMTMFQQTAPRLDGKALAELRKGLEKKR